MTKTLATTVFALSLVACGGNAESDSDPGVGGTGATSTGGKAGSGGGTSTGGSASGGASTGGSSAGGSSAGGTNAGGTNAGGTSAGGTSAGGAGGAGGQPECVEQTGGTGGAFVEPTCNDLSVMNVTDPVVMDESGDGKVSPGEKLTVHANLNEIAGKGFNMYPGVYFTSDNADVTIKENDWYYAIFACQTQPVSATGKIGANVAPGTVVTITARVGMINEECLTAPSIQIPITVQ